MLQNIPVRRLARKRNGSKEKKAERKLRKERKKIIDRRSKSRRRKETDEQHKKNRVFILEIVTLLPRKDLSDVGKKYLCVNCGQHYCINHHGDEEFCRTCWWGHCCSKTAMGKQKQCNFCEKKEAGSESHVMH